MVERRKLEQMISSIPADLRYPVIYDADGNKITGDLYDALMIRDLDHLYVEDEKKRHPKLGEYLSLLLEGRHDEAEAYGRAHKAEIELEYDAHAKSQESVSYGYTCIAIDGQKATLIYTPYGNEEWDRADAWHLGIPYKMRVKYADVPPSKAWYPVVGKKHLVFFACTPGGRPYVQPLKID